MLQHQLKALWRAAIVTLHLRPAAVLPGHHPGPAQYQARTPEPSSRAREGVVAVPSMRSSIAEITVLARTGQVKARPDPSAASAKVNSTAPVIGRIVAFGQTTGRVLGARQSIAQVSTGSATAISRTKPSQAMATDWMPTVFMVLASNSGSA